MEHQKSMKSLIGKIVLFSFGGIGRVSVLGGLTVSLIGIDLRPYANAIIETHSRQVEANKEEALRKEKIAQEERLRLAKEEKQARVRKLQVEIEGLELRLSRELRDHNSLVEEYNQAQKSISTLNSNIDSFIRAKNECDTKTQRIIARLNSTMNQRPVVMPVPSERMGDIARQANRIARENHARKVANAKNEINSQNNHNRSHRRELDDKTAQARQKIPGYQKQLDLLTPKIESAGKVLTNLRVDLKEKKTEEAKLQNSF